jgi:hypothetical protein
VTVHTLQVGRGDRRRRGTGVSIEGSKDTDRARPAVLRNRHSEGRESRSGDEGRSDHKILALRISIDGDGATVVAEEIESDAATRIAHSVIAGLDAQLHSVMIEDEARTGGRPSIDLVASA